MPIVRFAPFRYSAGRAADYDARAVRQPTYRAPRSWRSRPIFGVIGLRPPHAQHSKAEGALLRRFAQGSKLIVEIGVAEGGSAWEAASVMPADGQLVLIDPYMHEKSRIGAARSTARRLVAGAARGEVRWVRLMSHDAAAAWSTPIDFLFIDGDHTYEGVRRDWDMWTPHLAPEGRVALHDAHSDADWVHPGTGPHRLLEEIRSDPSWVDVAAVDSLAVLERA